MNQSPFVEALPSTVSGQARIALQIAIDRLGSRARAVVHRVARVRGALCPYDAWTTDVDMTPDGLVRRVRTGLEARDLARPKRGQMNKLKRGSNPMELEGWFYDERRLLARVVVTGAEEAPGSTRTAKANEFLKTWLREHAGQADGLTEGTLIVGPDGDLRGFDQEGLETWRGDPALVRLVRAAALRTGSAAWIITRGQLLVARRLISLKPEWIVDVSGAPDILVAVDAVLTPAQREVAHYAVAGATVQEIAKTLTTSPETVRSHLKSIYRRLDVANRVELARALAA